MIKIPFKDKQKHKEYDAQYWINNREKRLKQKNRWYIDNREMWKVKMSIARKKIRDFINDYKLSKGCAICGYNKCVAALEFHHNGDKEFLPNASSGRNIESLKEEINKCIVLCSNCHRELHYKQIKEVK